MNRRSFFEILGVASVALGLSKAAAAQSGSSAEARLKELGLTLPEPAGPAAVYVPYRLSGNQVFIAGNIPPLDVDVPTTGKVGADLTVKQGYAAARLAGLRVLAQLKVACELFARFHGSVRRGQRRIRSFSRSLRRCRPRRACRAGRKRTAIERGG
jgi:hypothetical protein